MSKLFHIFLIGSLAFWCSNLILCDDNSSVESEEDNSNETSNDTAQDLYVIRTIVYEIGILTNASNDSVENATQEKVDLSFINDNNGSGIDLSKIPLPVQTNISGTTITGVLPTNLTSLIELSNSSSPILPSKEVAITQNISTSDPDSGKTLISGLSKVLGLPVVKDKKEDDDEDDSEKLP